MFTNDAREQKDDRHLTPKLPKGYRELIHMNLENGTHTNKCHVVRFGGSKNRPPYQYKLRHSVFNTEDRKNGKNGFGIIII